MGIWRNASSPPVITSAPKSGFVRTTSVVTQMNWTIHQTTKTRFPSERWRSATWAFDHPLGKGYSGEKSAAGPIFLVPSQALRSWCHRYPDFAPEFLMRVAPLFEGGAAGIADPAAPPQPKQGGDPMGAKRWNPFVLQLLDDFGDREDVLSALSGNMFSFFSWGSRVPYYEQYVEPLRVLLNHHRSTVITWARRQLEAQEQVIRHAQSRDDEGEFGVY